MLAATFVAPTASFISEMVSFGNKVAFVEINFTTDPSGLVIPSALVVSDGTSGGTFALASATLFIRLTTASTTGSAALVEVRSG